jgi:hypothetical protein
MNEHELASFLERYVGMWHEPDPARRRQIVADLFAEDAENYTRRSVSRGVDEITQRVTRAHDEWVASKAHVFEPSGNTEGHHHLVKFFWRMRPKGGGPIVSIGLDIFVLNEKDRIAALYQFIEPPPG